MDLILKQCVLNILAKLDSMQDLHTCHVKPCMQFASGDKRCGVVDAGGGSVSSGQVS